MTYRHPSVLAAEALTIDHASHGRLELALGAAWFDKEHHELGIPFPPTGERFDLLEDTLEIVTRLFTGETVDYEGRKSLACSRRACSRCPSSGPTRRSGSAAPGPSAPCRWSAGSLTSGTPGAPPTACATPTPPSTATPPPPDATRRPIMRASSLSLDDLDTARRHAAKWRDAGYGYLVCGWPGAGSAQVEAFARDVLPEFSGD